jgi:uncharacterized damage-inducible protein DinB
MPTTDPIVILLNHDKWATRQILNTCATLTHEQFHQRFDMGPGSLHDTTTHILGAMRSWGDLLAGREFAPRLEAMTSPPAPPPIRSMVWSPAPATANPTPSPASA